MATKKEEGKDLEVKQQEEAAENVGWSDRSTMCCNLPAPHCGERIERKVLHQQWDHSRSAQLFFAPNSRAYVWHSYRPVCSPL